MKIIQPPGQPFDFQFIDGLENLLTRRETVGTTVGTGVDPLHTIPLVPNLFDVDAKMLWFCFVGNLAGVAGTKRILIQFDATSILDTGALATNNQNYFYFVRIWRRQTSFIQIRGDLFYQPFTGNLAAVTHLGKSDLLNPFDFSIAHAINIFGEVSNVADSVAIDVLTSGVL
jgi:hypothetical protein